MFISCKHFLAWFDLVEFLSLLSRRLFVKYGVLHGVFYNARI